MSLLEVLLESPLRLIGLFVASQVLLFAAREPVRRTLRALGSSVGGALRLLSRCLLGWGKDLRRRNHDSLLAHGRLELERKMEREIRRVDEGLIKHLREYPTLHRELRERIADLERELQSAGAPDLVAPGWEATAKALSDVPHTGDRESNRVLNSLKHLAEKTAARALREYRAEASKRHRILAAMAQHWREVKAISGNMLGATTRVVQTTQAIQNLIARDESLRHPDPSMMRSLVRDSLTRFVVSSIVIAVAVLGAAINFNLIALPMSELVPAGSRVAGVSVAQFAALAVVLMEVTAGLFVLDALGLTELLPKIGELSSRQRRFILVIGIGGLFLLACIESSLAILREQIVAADLQLQQAISGDSARIVTPASSVIPVVGQAVLGFILPWILMMVAMPLEMFIQSSQQVLAELVALALSGVGVVARLLSSGLRWLVRALEALFEIYVAIPVLLANGLRGRDRQPAREPAQRPMRTPVPISKTAKG